MTTTQATTTRVVFFMVGTGTGGQTFFTPSAPLANPSRAVAFKNGYSAVTGIIYDDFATTTTIPQYQANLGGGSDNTGQTVTLRPPSTPSSYTVVPASTSGSTCSGLNVVFTAKDSLGATLTAYTGSFTISTSTNHGNWTLSSGAGTFTAGAADSGAATYTFAAADAGTVTLSLSNTHADDLTAGASDTVFVATGTSSTINFRDNVFVLSSIDTIGSEVVAGRPHAMKAEMWRKDLSTGNCSIAAGYTGSKALRAWDSAGGSNPSATHPSLSAASACSSPALLTGAIPGANNFTVTFAAGVANFWICTADVGQYAVSLRDASRVFATGVDISGTSSTFAFRPFGLSIRSIVSGVTTNPAGTTTAGSKFVTPETAFGLTVAGVLWTAAQDADNNGVSDAGANLTANALTSSFANATTLSAASYTPALGAGGTLGGTTSILSGSYSGGSVSVSNLTWNNSGSLKISAASLNYLGSGFAVPGMTSGDIGRFYPANYVVSGASSANACAGGAFTYMDQPALSAALTLSAKGASGTTLSHHSAAASYGFLPTVTLAAVDNLDGTDRGSRLSFTAPSWAAGAWALSTSTATFTRIASPDGQFDSLQLGVWVNDPDGADLSVKDMSRSVAGACAGAGCTAKSIGSPLKLRHGRLWMGSSFSYALGGLPLNMPVQAQYWTRSAGGASLGWSLNALDSCTSIPAASISAGNYTGITSAAGGAFSLASGAGTLKVTPSPARTAGKADVAINLAATAGALNACPAPALPAATAANLPWLRSNFCSASYNQDPSARATFGPAKSSSDSLIFLRELY